MLFITILPPRGIASDGYTYYLPYMNPYIGLVYNLFSVVLGIFQAFQIKASTSSVYQRNLTARRLS